ncbi:hypothetical protein C8N46_104330 [Kordia periserrulae]|uniref:Uncharacterized protein n=1 Tax=Kordia periserrulae TaxID=701523 RepID=A0A2T6C055_9FLAO|nr:hypothetical protein [Kordia periserrulae]PTX61686.1 hypothetical protein C8N46_104330 [Kordia periserrulae]
MDFFTIMIIVISLVVFVFIVLIAFVMKKSKDVENAAFSETERTEIRQKLLKKRKKLAPYKADFYLEVTNAMTFQRTQAVTNLKISGLLYNKLQKPIVAFTRVERAMNAKGLLIAVTKKYVFRYEFLKQQITFFCDDELLGNMNASGSIANTDNKNIGQLKRTSETNSITLNNRVIADIQKAPLYDSISNKTDVTAIFEEHNFGSSLLSLHNSPTTEEEKWLIALAIFEIGYYGISPVV